MRIFVNPFVLLSLCILLLASSCAINPVTGRRQLVLMSEKQEISMGREYDPQLIAAFGKYDNEPLLRLIQEKGAEMGLKSHRPGLEYHFRILDSPVINAFAVPGGYIYLTRGILAQFNNEAEMIGVLGHEMGHITARHMVSRHARQTMGQLLLIGGMIASEEFRPYAGYAMAGMQLLFLSFSRADEREADQLGVEYTSKIGYDARKMADFYQVLVRMNLGLEHGGIPTFLSTHPDPGDRYNAVIRDAEKWNEKLDHSTWKVNRDRYLELLQGMVYGDDPRKGFTDGNWFYHPELEFEFPFPAGWKLENMPVQVRMAPQDGNALIVFTSAKGNTLEEAAEATLQQLELNVLSSERRIIGGMPAIAVLSRQVQGQAADPEEGIQVLSCFIDDNGSYYVFHGVSAQQDFESFRPSFESTMTGFSKLTNPSRLNVQPERIRIVRAKKSGTLANIFRSYDVKPDRMEEFGFLNNMELTDQVASGTLLKIAGQ